MHTHTHVILFGTSTHSWTASLWTAVTGRWKIWLFYFAGKTCARDDVVVSFKYVGKAKHPGRNCAWLVNIVVFLLHRLCKPAKNILLFPSPKKSGESCIKIAKNPGWTRAHPHVIKSQCFPHSYLSAKVRGTMFRLGRVACWWDASWGVPMPTMWSKRRDLAPLGVSLLYGGNEVLYYFRIHWILGFLNL